ncbi:hypothetical protein Bcep18194_C7061 [Burkholderia lata]|uniref:Uncharacterized protein n=1 Tax=Burkholderia lata (strain ATCC 17760 / DSM 23089 / LMG 22485 / NCIMB 9086 / R18194 / 383) TaxID=482957 RepID=Q39N60_BURL3|nr:hypothetical protein Bcep18194_C7061 [Burkholderia lata]
MCGAGPAVRQARVKRALPHDSGKPAAQPGCAILRGCAGILGETGRKSGERRENDDYNTAFKICVLHYNVVCAEAGPPTRRREPAGRPGDAASAPGIFIDDSTPPEWKLQ